jgi:hypothetical protein
MRAVVAVLVALAGVAHADDYGDATVIFARGTSLYRVSATGKNETEIATLPAKPSIRVLRTDANGKLLLVDNAGAWSYLPLDGSTKTLVDLPCGAGPALLTEDASCVVCRATTGTGSIIYNFAQSKAYPIDVVASRVVGLGADRKLVWADADGMWTAPVAKVANKTKVGNDTPVRGFLPSPDGTHAVGVYADEVYESVKKKKPGEIFTVFALDGVAAHRRLAKLAMPLDWSHDSHYVLVQDGATACLTSAAGGEYKCWRGYTGVSLSPDGRWGLVVGNGKPPGTVSTDPNADIAIVPPSGSLFRTRLEGAFTDKPTLIVKTVDGAAVWVPKQP